MKRLVINADDFGLCDSVSRGILDCYTKGIVSDFSFIINPETFAQSVGLLREKGINHCGIHLNLTMGKPLTGIGNSLTDSDGYLLSAKKHFIHAFTGRLKTDEVYREFKCQFDTMQAAGIQITHLDTHQNLHLLPQVNKAILRIRDENGGLLPIRIPSECIDLRHRYKTSNLQRIMIFNILSLFAKAGPKPKVSVKTIGGDYFNNPEPLRVLQNIMPRIRASRHNMFECAVHPGYNSDDILKYDPYTLQREKELAQLIAPMDDFKQHGIEICSFRSLLD